MSETARTGVLWAPSGILSIDKAGSLRDALLGILAKGEGLSIDLSSVEDLDLSCLQVLIAARLQALESGQVFGFTGRIAPRVVERLLRCGFVLSPIEKGEDFELALAAHGDKVRR
jgi:anti-anti-sigma regulatory factor